MTEHLRETVVHSEVVFTGRLLTIRVDTVRLPNGMESTREIVVHPGGVGMVALTDDDRVLLVRQWRSAAGRAMLEIPAGTLSVGEDPRDCAARELMEEVGFRPGKLTPLGITMLAPGYSAERLHLFLAEQLTPERLAHDEDENIEVVAVTWDEIDTLLQNGVLGDAKTISGLFLAQKLLQRRAQV